MGMVVGTIDPGGYKEITVQNPTDEECSIGIQLTNTKLAAQFRNKWLLLNENESFKLNPFFSFWKGEDFRAFHEDKGTKFSGKQIVHYDSERIIAFGVFNTLRGTIFVSADLWWKLGSLLFISTVFGAVVVFSTECHTDVDHCAVLEISISTNNTFNRYLNTLVAFTLGLFTSVIIRRWWTVRTVGVGGVLNAINDLNFLVLHNILPEAVEAAGESMPDKVFFVLTRYGLLVHALLFLVWGSDMSSSQILSNLLERKLITEDEAEAMRGIPKGSLPYFVWSWMGSYVNFISYELKIVRNPSRVVPKLLAKIVLGRRATQATSTYITSQVPMPYVHLISLLVNVFQVVIGLTTGVLAFGYSKTNALDSAMVYVSLCIITCTMWQGVLELCEKISNPLGNDDVDFPMFALEAGCEKCCYSMYAAEARKPWSLEKRRRPTFFDGKKKGKRPKGTKL